MITSLHMKWLTIAFLLLLLPLAVPTARAQSNNQLEHPGKMLQEHRQDILLLSSDKEVLTFNQRFIPQRRPLRHARGREAPSHPRKVVNAIPQETKTTITTFWAALTTIGYLQELRATPESSLPHHVLNEIIPSETQRRWLLSKPSLEGLTYLLEFHDKLSTWAEQQPSTPSSQDHALNFDNLASKIAETSNQQTWIDLFNKLGFNGIRAKLEHYWQSKNQQALPETTSDSLRQSAIQHYIEFRLFPIFHTHLLAQAIQVEAQAYQLAWESWSQIQEWQQEERAHLAKNRLCGTWKWIVHNHQNHGDHKTTMTFSSPEESAPSQMQPSTILVHGDTVYLKWTFPQGIQEDSLLMSNRDTRLEGTFTNSLGPHGSISGKRLSPCQD